MDDIDRAQAHTEAELEAAIAAARGVPIPEGVPGDCDLCGEWTGRLVEGLCAPCRDWVAVRGRRRIR
ncbi:MAG: hypothetical protein MUE59_13185 [Thiobacillaceae bacterium]|jgi:hypothetical protein|nr:hypothetical protein [Thiobacillaceae bacterium]